MVELWQITSANSWTKYSKIYELPMKTFLINNNNNTKWDVHCSVCTEERWIKEKGVSH